MHQNTRANYLHVKTWLLLGNKADSVAETSPHQVLSVANVSLLVMQYEVFTK